MYDSNLFSAVLNLDYCGEVLKPDPIPCYAEKNLCSIIFFIVKDFVYSLFNLLSSR